MVTIRQAGRGPVGYTGERYPDILSAFEEV